MKRFYTTTVRKTKLIASCMLLLAGQLAAQNIDNLSVKKGVAVTGSINANMIHYTANGIQNRRDPFNWFLNGSLNINLFGYDMPFSFSYSNAAKTYTQPFNQMRLAPKYKWIKAYIGDASMSFSNYTLAGHLFNGAGVELTPGKWAISALYGRLQKAVAYDPFIKNENTIAYKRMGYGAKVGYNNNGDSYELIFFTARDAAGSLLYIPQEVQLSPMQNIVVGGTVKKRISQHLFADVEYALSSLNTNTRAAKTADSSHTEGGHNLLGKLLPSNSTNRYFDAVNGGVGYNGSWYTIQLRYERVSPGYTTLGAYYFNNDLRNTTIAPGMRLLQGKLNINGNLGFQRNNLDQTRTNDTRRFIGSTTISYVPDEHWNYNFGYSNFNTYTKSRPQSDPFFQNQLDTLNFYQVTNNINGGVMRSFGSQEKVQSLSLNMSYQRASDQSGANKNLSSFVNGILGYTYSLTRQAFTLNSSFSYNTNAIGAVKTVFWGPNVNASKGLLKNQVRLSGSTAYNAVSTNGTSSGNVLNVRTGAAYTPASENKKGRHNISLNVNYLNRLNGTPTQPKYNELTSTLNYSYSF